jgi:hypothetical protein
MIYECIIYPISIEQNNPFSVRGVLLTQGFEVQILQTYIFTIKKRCTVFKYIAKGEKAPRRGFEPRT